MSRSRRKPYSAITGIRSAKQDKRLAARGVRRKQNQVLNDVNSWEDSLLPHRYECHWNDVWSWDRDGNQMYWGNDLDWGNAKWRHSLFRK